MVQYFSDYVNNHTQVSKEIIDQLLMQCYTVSLSKGEMLRPQGDISRKSYFVQKGLLRYYSIDNKGKEHVLQFAPEGWFISDRQSACTIEKSDFFIEALEETNAVVLDQDFLNNLSEQSASFLEFNTQLLQNHIRQLQNRINQLLSYSAEERYLDFIRIYPDILILVPQAMIASYLGITPESLSRVRKDIALRHQKKQ